MDIWIKTQMGNLVNPRNIIINDNYGSLQIIERLSVQCYIELGEYEKPEGYEVMKKIEEFICNNKNGIFYMP
jgi:hypothetical protein